MSIPVEPSSFPDFDAYPHFIEVFIEEDEPFPKLKTPPEEESSRNFLK